MPEERQEKKQNFSALRKGIGWPLANSPNNQDVLASLASASADLSSHPCIGFCCPPWPWRSLSIIISLVLSLLEYWLTRTRHEVRLHFQIPDLPVCGPAFVGLEAFRLDFLLGMPGKPDQPRL